MRSWLAPTAHLLGVGWYFAACIILGIWIGHVVDQKTGLEPVFTLAGIFLGLAVALVGGVQMLRPFMKRLNSGPPEKY